MENVKLLPIKLEPVPNENYDFEKQIWKLI